MEYPAQVKIFIAQQVRDRPWLYDPRHPDFNKPLRYKDSYLEIANSATIYMRENYGDNYPYSRHHVQAIWKLLRSGYRCSYFNNNRMIPYRFAEHLRFLDRHMVDPKRYARRRAYTKQVVLATRAILKKTNEDLIHIMQNNINLDQHLQNVSAFLQIVDR